MQIENKNLEIAITFVALTLTMLVTRYLGIFAMPFVLGAYLINSIANKDYSSLYLYVASLGILAIFLEPTFIIEKAMLGIPFLLVAVTLIKRKLRGDKLVIVMTFTFVVSIIAYLALLREFFDINFVDIFNASIDRQVEMIKSLEGEFVFDKDMVTLAYQEFKRYLASMVFFLSFVVSFIALKLPHYIVRKRGDINLSEPFIEALKLNKSAFYSMLAILLVFTMTDLGLNQLIVDNISFMIFITLAIQGLSFIMFVLKIRYKKKMVANFYFAFSIIFLGFMFFVNIIFGFIDGATKIRGA